jgi:hypothetical protein
MSLGQKKPPSRLWISVAFVTDGVEWSSSNRDILIEVAVIGYGREPDFERKAAGQLAMSEIITIALQEAPEFQSDDQALGVAKHDLLEDGSPRGTLCSRFVDALQPPQMSISQTLSSLGKRFLGKL